MNGKEALAGLAVIGLLAAAPTWSHAQATSTVTVQTEAHSGTVFKEATSDDAVVTRFNLTVGKIKGKDIRNADGKIGDVDKVLIDKDGQVAAVTVDAGGFLGVGSKEVIMGLDQLALQDDHFVTTLTKEQVKTLPEWHD